MSGYEAEERCVKNLKTLTPIVIFKVFIGITRIIIDDDLNVNPSEIFLTKNFSLIILVSGSLFKLLSLSFWWCQLDLTFYPPFNVRVCGNRLRFRYKTNILPRLKQRELLLRYWK